MSAGAENPIHARLLRQFSYEHLPLELQALSRPFQTLAVAIVDGCRRYELNPADTTIALRKLLEAKDAYVRASLS